MARTFALDRWLDLLLGVPLVALVSLRRKKQLPKAPQRIGAICPSAIGDLILDTGLLSHLKQTYPAAEIHLFHGKTNRGALPLLATSLVAHECNFKDIFATSRVMRAVRVDVMIDLTPWPRLTALNAIASGAVTVGFHSVHQYRHYAFDVAVPNLHSRHMADNLRAMASVFSPCPEYRPTLQIAPEMVPDLRYDRLILCHIAPGGSRAAAKTWPVERWAELTKKLAAEGFRVGFTGVNADAALVDEVLSLAKCVDAFSLCGRLSLAELATALTHVRLLITVDTGVLHLAAALGVLTLGLHGPTSSRRWGGFAPNCVSIDAPHPAAGHIHFGFESHPQASAVMRTIEVDTVFTTALEILAQEKPSISP